MSHLQAVGLHKSYGGKTVLNSIDLDIGDGEFVSLLGPSGCGKTTTLRLIAGFERPDNGSILVGGQRLDGVPSHKRDVGVVFQHYALFPHLSARQNIAFGLQRRKIAKSETASRVEEAMDTVQLGEFGDRMPAQLSGGQQQRVALARALVTRPKVLLLDESLSALDKKLRTAMQIELRQIQQKVGITTIFVTHDQEEALTMSDRIAVMREGRIAQFDTPEAIYSSPADSFVAQAVGDINIVAGTVTATPDGWSLLVPDGQQVPLVTDRELVEGESIQIGIRPQDLRVTAVSADQSNDNVGKRAVTGSVLYATFAGSAAMMGVHALGQELKIQSPTQRGEELTARPGDQVTVSWRGGSLHLFAPDSD